MVKTIDSFPNMSRLHVISAKSKSKNFNLPSLDEVESVIKSRDAVGLIRRNDVSQSASELINLESPSGRSMPQDNVSSRSATDLISPSGRPVTRREPTFDDEFEAPDLDSSQMRSMFEQLAEESRKENERSSPKKKNKKDKKLYDARNHVDQRKLRNDQAPEIGDRGNRRRISVQELDLDIIYPNYDNYLDPKTSGYKVVMIGKTGTGKTTALRSIMYEKSEIIPCAQVYSGSEEFNHQYSEFIPDIFILDNDSDGKWDKEAYRKMIKRQKIAVNYLQNPWSIIIWDDIISKKKQFDDPMVKNTYKIGRHWKILHFLLLQYGMDIEKDIRANIDGAFLFRETKLDICETLFKTFSGGIETFRDFRKILDFYTKDFKALYIHNRGSSSDFKDCVFFYEARKDIPKDFKFGAQEAWMYNDEIYEPNSAVEMFF
jgi:hypothetical protein